MASSPKSRTPPNSTAMQLKCDEILSHVRISDELVTQINSSSAILRKDIIRIPERPPISVLEAERGVSWLSDVCIPFKPTQPIKDLNYKLLYEKPRRVEITGSFLRKTISRAQNPLTIDVAVVVPATVFKPKDHLNYRYFHKRAYYLACIAAGLTHAFEKYERIEYAFQDENLLQPILKITPPTTSFTGKISYSFRLLFSLEDESMFTYEKLKKRPGGADSGLRGNSDDRQVSLEALYNSTLVSESIASGLSQFIASMTRESQAFVDACMLGSIWLRQRGFHGTLSRGGFGNFEWSCITALLLAKGRYNGVASNSRGYSSLQIFKIVLQFLAASDLCDRGVLLPSKEAASDFKQMLGSRPFLLDDLHGLNILYKMTSASYLDLRRCALKTLKVLEQPTSDQFYDTFIKNFDIKSLHYDYYFEMALILKHSKGYSTNSAYEQGSWRLEHIQNTLRKGLGDRVRYIQVRSQETDSWRLTESNYQELEHGIIGVGLCLDAEKVESVMDKGPPADDEQSASSFRKFWNEKAELRRFPNGEILEVVIWDKKSSESSIVPQIVRFLLENKLEMPHSSVKEINYDHEYLLQRFQTRAFPDKQLFSAYETFERQLRELKHLPLHIRQVHLVRPRIHPLSNTPASPSCLADVHLQFEASSRWPESIEGICRAKIALLLKIGELLDKSQSNVNTRLALDDERYHMRDATLHIHLSSGVQFCLRIYTEREEILMRKALDASSKSTVEREAQASLLAGHKRDYVQTPSHANIMRKLSTRYSCLTGCVNSMKRWRDSHLLTNHVDDTLIELLVLCTFLLPGSYDAPGTVRVAFLRTLQFIARWDWRSDPLIIDIGGKMTASDVRAILTHFEAWRRIDPAMNKLAMFLATDSEQHGTAWTRERPSLVAAARLTALAKAATAIAVDQDRQLRMCVLFEPNLNEYDFLIHFRAPSKPDKEFLESRFQNLATRQMHSHENESIQKMFLADLQYMYDGVIVFFMGSDDVQVTGAIWHPKSTNAEPWKIRIGHSNHVVPDATSGHARTKINQEAVLNDIARLGEGLINEIQTNI